MNKKKKTKQISRAERIRREEAAEKSRLICEMKKISTGEQTGQLGDLARKSALNTKRKGSRYDGQLKMVHQTTGKEKIAAQTAQRMGIKEHTHAHLIYPGRTMSGLHNDGPQWYF